jgi:hypothetical protein
VSKPTTHPIAHDGVSDRAAHHETGPSRDLVGRGRRDNVRNERSLARKGVTEGIETRLWKSEVDDERGPPRPAPAPHRGGEVGAPP